MMARRLLMASKALRWVQDDPGPQPVYGGRMSFVGGGLFETVRLPSGRMALHTSSPAATGADTVKIISYSSGGRVGFATLDTQTFRHRLKKVDSEGATIFESGDIDVGSLFSAYATQCLEDRVATIRNTGSAHRVDSMGWGGPAEHQGSVSVPAWLNSRMSSRNVAVGTVDAQAMTAIIQGGNPVQLTDGRIVRGGREIPYDYFTVGNRASEEPLLGAMFDTPSGAPREIRFEPFPECDVAVPPGSNAVPVHLRTHECRVKAVAFGVDGGAWFIGSCTVTEMRWDGSIRNVSPREITASLARNTSEFIARIHPSGQLSLVRLLSRNSWWFELQDFMLGQDFAGGEHRIIFTGSGSGKFSTPRVITQAPDNFNFAGKPPVTQVRDAIIQNGPRSWAVLDGMTYLDHGRSFMLLRDGAWNSGVFWMVGTRAPEKIETSIPSGNGVNDRIGVFEDEQAWILLRAGSGGGFFERSAATGWVFTPTEAANVFGYAPEAFYSV